MVKIMIKIPKKHNKLIVNITYLLSLSAMKNKINPETKKPTIHGSITTIKDKNIYVIHKTRYSCVTSFSLKRNNNKNKIHYLVSKKIF